MCLTSELATGRSKFFFLTLDRKRPATETGSPQSHLLNAFSHQFSQHTMFSRLLRTAAPRTTLQQAVRAVTVLDIKGVKEEIITRSDYPIEKCKDILKDEVITILGYGPQGRGQALNIRDNGFNVSVGVIQDKTYDHAVKDGWVPGKVCHSPQCGPADSEYSKNPHYRSMCVPSFKAVCLLCISRKIVKCVFMCHTPSFCHFSSPVWFFPHKSKHL